LHHGLHVDSRKTGALQQALELRRLGKGMFAPLDPGGVNPKDFIQRDDEGVRAWCSFNRAINAQGGSAGTPEHTAHLPQG
jgi:hypothetical protein